MVTKEWTAVHRKHHAKMRDRRRPAQPADLRPAQGAAGRRRSCTASGPQDAETLAKYGHGTPDDWMERNVYSRHSVLGVALMMVINLVLFGFAGLTIWAVQMAWIPIFAAGVINGVGHHTRLPQLPDRRCQHQHRPVGHPDRRRRAAQQPPRLRLVGAPVEQMVRVRHRLAVHPRDGDCSGWRRSSKLAPSIRFEMDKARCDLHTLQAVITHRYDVVARFGAHAR